MNTRLFGELKALIPLLILPFTLHRLMRNKFDICGKCREFLRAVLRSRRLLFYRCRIDSGKLQNMQTDGPALRTRRRSSTQDPHPKVATGVRADASAAYAEPDRKRTKLTAEPTDGPAQRTRRHSSTHDPRPKVTTRVREGVLTEDELEELSQRLGISWEKLGRRLEFHEADITGFHKNNEEYDKKAMSMLFEWEKNNGSGATYEVLHTALCHKLVKRRDLAEEFCQVTR